MGCFTTFSRDFQKGQKEGKDGGRTEGPFCSVFDYAMVEDFLSLESQGDSGSCMACHRREPQQPPLSQCV